MYMILVREGECWELVYNSDTNDVDILDDQHYNFFVGSYQAALDYIAVLQKDHSLDHYQIIKVEFVSMPC